jgi:hypothetical protein
MEAAELLPRVCELAAQQANDLGDPANNAILMLATDGGGDLSAQAVVIGVNGYFE